MSGKSPYASDAERKAAKAESGRRRIARLRNDPVLYEQFLLAQREKAALAAERKMMMLAMPQPVNVALYRQHGPWAPLFALQA